MELKEEARLSKRQRRKLPNDKHKWPQQPKIQSMEARNRAYIRVAGLGGSSHDQIVKDVKAARNEKEKSDS